MSMKYKRSYKVYSAWNYQKEIEDLNHFSEQGLQLVYGGCFHSKFVKNADVRYRYQLDYQKVDNMGRYIETFREQGWEYVNSTFNGWHYFRKLYDPALPQEAYEIFTDQESLIEMNRRWARLALILAAIIGVFAVLSAVRMILRPQLPTLVQLITFLVESLVLLRGGLIMRNPDVSRNRRGDGVLMVAFLVVILAGCTTSIALSQMRPHLSVQQQTESISEPIVDNRWLSFDVRYPDCYYLDLDIDADAPLTINVVNAAGETVYSQTETDFSEEDINIKLARGEYWFSMSCDAGFALECYLN